MMFKNLILVSTFAIATSGFAYDEEEPMQMSGDVRIGEKIELPERFGDGKYCIVNISNRSKHDVDYYYAWKATKEPKEKLTVRSGWCKWQTLDCSKEEPQIRHYFNIKYDYHPGKGEGWKNETILSGRSGNQTCEDGPMYAFYDKGGKIRFKQVRREPPVPFED